MQEITACCPVHLTRHNIQPKWELVHPTVEFHKFSNQLGHLPVQLQRSLLWGWNRN
uniref:Uncharacterized protein n=1 Tax=Rhizophora mucronata TaxID=61149 RepID=A0A2P2IZ76_RHIMU